jgi:Flp pilus assembly CpaF family ATPase
MSTQTQAQVYRERQLESLRRTLGDDVLALLSDPSIVEIMLNQDGRIWADVMGGGMEPRSTMDPVRAKMVIETVASMLDTSITKETPIISGELPLDGSRFEAQIPPIVESPTFTIRKKALLIFTLDDYVNKGILSARQRDIIIDAVRNRKNILVSGGTGCHDADAPILMHDVSTKRAADIQVGDMLMGPNGKPRRVLLLHRGIDEMVRVTPVDGEPFIVNSGHILSLMSNTRKIINITVRDYLGQDEQFKDAHKLWRAHDGIRPVSGFTIEPIGRGNYYGFQIDGDHLYLDGQFFVHHNSGKTTLSNAILHAVSQETPEHRIVIIEDTRELQCAAPNVVFFRTSDEIDMTRLLKSTMRMRPDRIIVGEVRGKEALDLLKAWNTGHPGGIGTVHANDAKAALVRIGMLIQEANVPPNPELIAEAVNIVISIKRAPGGRVVDEVLAVTGYENGRFLVEAL